jgi:hypothetical protein
LSLITFILSEIIATSFSSFAILSDCVAIYLNLVRERA